MTLRDLAARATTWLLNRLDAAVCRASNELGDADE